MISQLRNYWPGTRWVIAFIAGGMLVSGTAVAVSANLAREAEQQAARRAHYCQLVRERPVERFGNVVCDGENP